MTKKNVQVSSLGFLTSQFCALRGVGPFLEKSLAKLAGGNRVFNLLLVRPLRAEAIKFCPLDLSLVQSDELVVLHLKIEQHLSGKSRRAPYKIVGRVVKGDGGYVSLVFFKIFPSQKEKLAVGKEVLVLGHFKKSGSENQIVHPQEIRGVDEEEKLPKINLIYPLSGALTQKFVRGKIEEVLKFLQKRFDRERARKNDWIDVNLLEEKGWPLFVEALAAVHNFGFEFGPNAQEKGFERLKFDELLAWQIANLLVKERGRREKSVVPLVGGNVTQGEGVPFSVVEGGGRDCRVAKVSRNDGVLDLAEEFLSELPFEATKAQIRACKEVRGEVLSSKLMLRLLQGDVGSGKTVVALYSCLLAVSCQRQACVIVPLGILADQHFAYFKKMVAKKGVKVEILTGKTTKKKREKLFTELENGEIDILVSTHAVLEEGVKFRNLGLAVIDEQHRFGVMQRLKLVEKGRDVDVLLMSATPIPRSLMMSFYGEMDISVLDEKPKNRLEIETLVKAQGRGTEVLDGVKRALKRGEKIYWICPLVDEVEGNVTEGAGTPLPGEGGQVVTPLPGEGGQVGRTLPGGKVIASRGNDFCDEGKKDSLSQDLRVSAASKYRELCEVFGEKAVGLIHGKMKPQEKDKVMNTFKEGGPGILVATTVIEVGVDVPSATVIVIENAESFGLSQLHQLRGRVGRGEKKSFCILLYGKKYGNIAKERLGVMRKSSDGFFIAEEDLRLRGSGEMIGTRQSGVPELLAADLAADLDLVKLAGEWAQRVVLKGRFAEGVGASLTGGGGQKAHVVLDEPLHLDDRRGRDEGALDSRFRALLKVFGYEDCLRVLSGG